MKVLVRPVRKGDWKRVLAIEDTLLNPWDMQDHREFLHPDRNCTYVATDGREVFGFVSATVMPGYVLVERLAVAEEYRVCGVGRGLLDSLEHWFATDRCRQIQCVVSEYAVATQVFLRACGWKWVKSVRWGDEGEEYLMVKEFKR